MAARKKALDTAITVPKLRRGPIPSLGQDALKSNRKPRPITRAQIEQIARQAKHGRCVDHVTVEGLRGKVCILKGQDPDVVVAEAKALAGLD